MWSPRVLAAAGLGGCLSHREPGFELASLSDPSPRFALGCRWPPAHSESLAAWPRGARAGVTVQVRVSLRHFPDSGPAWAWARSDSPSTSSSGPRFCRACQRQRRRHGQSLARPGLSLRLRLPPGSTDGQDPSPSRQRPTQAGSHGPGPAQLEAHWQAGSQGTRTRRTPERRRVAAITVTAQQQLRRVHATLWHFR